MNKEIIILVKIYLIKILKLNNLNFIFLYISNPLYKINEIIKIKRFKKNKI